MDSIKLCMGNFTMQSSSMVIFRVEGLVQRRREGDTHNRGRGPTGGEREAEPGRDEYIGEGSKFDDEGGWGSGSEEPRVRLAVFIGVTGLETLED